MIDRKQISKMAKQILHRQRGLQEPQIIHPSREWILGILFAMVLFVLISAWSAQTYITYRSIDRSGEVKLDGEVIIYRESLVQSALEHFNEKEKEFARLRALPVEQTVNTDTTEEIEEPDSEAATATSSELSPVENDTGVSENSEEQNDIRPVADPLILDTSSSTE